MHDVQSACILAPCAVAPDADPGSRSVDYLCCFEVMAQDSRVGDRGPRDDNGTIVTLLGTSSMPCNFRRIDGANVPAPIAPNPACPSVNVSKQEEFIWSKIHDGHRQRQIVWDSVNSTTGSKEPIRPK